MNESDRRLREAAMRAHRTLNGEQPTEEERKQFNEDLMLLVRECQQQEIRDTFNTMVRWFAIGFFFWIGYTVIWFIFA